MTCFCPCIVVAETAEYLEPGTKTQVLIIWIALNLCELGFINLCLYDCPHRQKIAEKAGIQDSNGCLKVCCCNSCSTCQVANQRMVLQGAGNAPAQQEMQ